MLLENHTIICNFTCYCHCSLTPNDLKRSPVIRLKIVFTPCMVMKTNLKNIYIKRMKKQLKNEQRSRDAVAKKELIQVE